MHGLGVAIGHLLGQQVHIVIVVAEFRSLVQQQLPDLLPVLALKIGGHGLLQLRLRLLADLELVQRTRGEIVHLL